MLLEELAHTLMEERDREARQIAFCATATSRDGGMRRRLGYACIRLGLWLHGAPSGSPPGAEAKHPAKRMG